MGGGALNLALTPPVFFFKFIYNRVFIITVWVLRHTAWMTTFSCNKLNLCFDPLSVVGFWLLLAFWKAYYIRKRIAQVLQRSFSKLFAWNQSKEIFPFFFANIYFKLDFAKERLIFANFQIFLLTLKVEHKSFSMMYNFSYLDIKQWYPRFQVHQRQQGKG